MPKHRTTCTECTTPFIAQRSDARYCSHKCRQRAYRRRQREKRREERARLAELEQLEQKAAEKRLINLLGRLLGRLTRWWKGD